ncbi:MAG: Thoeris anti-defense Tad2 family protein [Geminicoccaceae bacterium]
MKFDQAWIFIRNGRKMYRSGWNGEGLYVAAQYPDENSINTLPYCYIQGDGVGGASLGHNRGVWFPSMGDLFAEDWEEVV